MGCYGIGVSRLLSAVIEQHARFLKDEVVFSMDSKNESGEINISFVNDSGEELFSFKNPDSVTKTLTINKEKKYIIKITGKDHKGSFKVSWN